jgi:hypothetical protein
MKLLSLLVVLLALTTVATFALYAPNDFEFAILGDRTGGAVEGVYEQALRETSKDLPAFILNVGDTIQGGNDRTVETEWEFVEAVLAPYRRYRILFTPGNHDVWSELSLRSYIHHTHRPLHYGFDYKQVHVSVLNNSRSDDIPASELDFLRQDLEAHKNQPIKIVVSHRPAWILQVILGNPAFPLHQLATRYGVKYIIAGHIHQMLRFDLDGVTYLSMASSGGHLRETKTYDRGWFFHHTLVKVRRDTLTFQIKELQPPFGKGRVTSPSDWGAAGLIRR